MFFPPVLVDDIGESVEIIGLGNINIEVVDTCNLRRVLNGRVESSQVVWYFNWVYLEAQGKDSLKFGSNF